MRPGSIAVGATSRVWVASHGRPVWSAVAARQADIALSILSSTSADRSRISRTITALAGTTLSAPGSKRIDPMFQTLSSPAASAISL